MARHLPTCEDTAVRHNPKEALVEQGPDQAEGLSFWEMGSSKGQSSIRGCRAGAREKGVFRSAAVPLCW